MFEMENEIMNQSLIIAQENGESFKQDDSRFSMLESHFSNTTPSQTYTPKTLSTAKKSEKRLKSSTGFNSRKQSKVVERSSSANRFQSRSKSIVATTFGSNIAGVKPARKSQACSPTKNMIRKSELKLKNLQKMANVLEQTDQ